jgi:hypothetical protein
MKQPIERGAEIHTQKASLALKLTGGESIESKREDHFSTNSKAS